MLSLLLAATLATDLPSVDLARLDSGTSGASVARDGEKLSLQWPTGPSKEDSAAIEFDLGSGRRLISSIALIRDGRRSTLVEKVDPVVFVVVGTRENPPGRPPEMSLFNVFFDTPANRPHQASRGKLDLKSVRVESERVATSVSIGSLSAGPFEGNWRFTVYRGSPLIQVEAVLRTDREKTAYLYDAGLIASEPPTPRLVWTDTEGRTGRASVDPRAGDRAISVRYRSVAAESDAGSLVLFPPPHRYFFPRDRTDNLKHIWFGRGHRALEDGWGIGIRQAELGGGAFVPWFNAPPGSVQHMGLFLLPVAADGERANAEALKFTRGDRFADVPGYTTFTSHWHMAVTMEAMARSDKSFIPDWVRMFKAMNVRIVHLGEFHGDGHPSDPGPIRLKEMAAMFEECRRLSDDRLLVIPGEEANAHLGLKILGRHPGHYMLLFPRPVHWVMNRAEGMPFESEDPRYGKVYRVGNLDEMRRLLDKEQGLAWTAHPRIKASNWTPDIFKDEPFYKSETWLGAAWKAMPADLSRERLGDRCLDLLSDMANWGDAKFMPGEVDVFKIDHTHELFGHMNINYLKLDKVPTHEEGWKPVLDRLRGGKFWVTTGEVLLKDITLGGAEGGDVLSLADDRSEARLKGRVEWTFPPAFLEVVSGDGAKVYRARVPLSGETAFGGRDLDLKVDLRRRKWARVEVWDVAGNGAFTQPIRIKP